MKTLPLSLALLIAPLAFLSAEEDLKELVETAAARISNAGTFEITAQRKIDDHLQFGHAVPRQSTITATGIRPDKVRIDIDGDGVHRELRFNGEELWLVDHLAKVYSRVPEKGDLDSVSDLIETRLGFIPPLLDFLRNTPAPHFFGPDTKVSDHGTQKVEGISCRVIKGEDPEAAWTLWIEADSNLPKKLQVTSVRLEGKPTVEVVLEQMRLDVPPAEPDAFTFMPTEGFTEAAILTDESLVSPAAQEKAAQEAGSTNE